MCQTGAGQSLCLPGSSASLSLSRFVPGTGGHMVMRHRSATPSSLLIRPNLSNPKIHCQLLSNQQDNLVSLTLDILVQGSQTSYNPAKSSAGHFSSY